MRNQSKNPGYFRIYESPVNGTKSGFSLPIFYIYLLKDKNRDFKPFGGCAQEAVVKKVPKFAEKMKVGIQDDIEFVGFIKCNVAGGIAKTSGYNPKQNARNAPKIGSYLDICIAHYLGKNSVEFMQTTSVPSDSRAHQIKTSGGICGKPIPIADYKRGMAKRVKAEVNKFLGSKVETEPVI